MSISYYPGEWAKMKMHVIEQMQQPDMLHSVFGTHNINESSLSVGVWCPKSWEVRRVSLNFNDILAKDYSISVVRGIGVVTGKNDRLWVKGDAAAAQEVIIPQGFYTGATLATALTAALNACDFAAASMPFTVAFDSATGEFTITPAAGNATIFVPGNGHTKYIGGIMDRPTEYAPVGPARTSSTLAPLIGFTTTTSAAAALVSDTPLVFGGAMGILSDNDSTSSDISSINTIAMTIDNQLVISVAYPASDADASSSSSSASLDAQGGLVSYEVVYKILDA